MSIDLMNAPMGKSAVEPEKEIIWSTLQRNIFHQIAQDSEQSIIVEAVAGGAKTTTIIEAINYIPPSESTLFLAFNKAIVQELSSRLPPHVEAKTFHSLGMSIIRKQVGQLEVSFSKIFDLFDEIYGKPAFNREYGNKLALRSLVDYAKGNGHHYSNETGPVLENWVELIDYHDLDFVGNISGYLKQLSEVYVRSLEDTSTIDFNDMLLHPVALDYTFPLYDNIVVDEAQDLNSLQHEFLRKMAKKRVIAVGDTHQAIYGFRGADASSMMNLKKMFSMEQMELNYSYRCPKAVASLVQEFVINFLPIKDAVEGEISTIFELPEPESILNDTLVLCRYNAPLFKYGMEFLSKRKPVQLRTNLGTTLKSRIKKFKAKSTTAWRQQLGAWRDTEKQKLLDKEKYSRIATLEDTYKTLLALSEGASQVTQITKNLDYLISSKTGPILSTIHKAKGLEAKVVMIVDYGSMPSQWAKLDWMQVQERNITYVAITRAKETLILHYKEER